MQKIFIDESYDGEVFVLAALKAYTVETVEDAIRDVRKKIAIHNKNCKGKSKIVLPEIHEHALHGKHYNVKRWTLDSIFSPHREVAAHAVWYDIQKIEFQSDIDRYKIIAKELLADCGVNDVGQIHFDVFCDTFRPHQQQRVSAYLINELGNPNLNIKFADSQAFSPLQAVDVIAGTFRRNLHDEPGNRPYYKIIRPHIGSERQYKK